MSLAFLYPLAWLGALAVAVPIWLHLRRRHETSLVRFSALQFLDDQPLARKRPLWPRDWPLLLLRLLALMLLVAAFTWPYLRGRAEHAGIEESWVYILDNTLSNQAEGAFQKARDDLVREVSAAGPERQVAVVELAAMPRVLAGFGDDRAEAVDRLRALKPSFQRGSYLAAFRAADSLLRQSVVANKRIILVGDSQENQWAEAGQVLPFLENVEITLPEVAQASRPNVALAQPSVQRLFLDDRTIAECTARLFHQGDQKAATVVFCAGDKEVARREVKLAGQPESITVSAQWETDPARWLQGEVRLEGQQDALGADDRVVFALAPVREGRVALLARSPFLQAALSPDVMKGRWATRVLRAPEPRTLNPEEEVLCLESHFLQAAPARSLVQSCLSSGKGVVLVVDQAGPTVAGFLRELGIEGASEAERGFRVQGSGFGQEGRSPDSLVPERRTLPLRLDRAPRVPALPLGRFRQSRGNRSPAPPPADAPGQRAWCLGGHAAGVLGRGRPAGDRVGRGQGQGVRPGVFDGPHGDQLAHPSDVYPFSRPLPGSGPGANQRADCLRARREHRLAGCAGPPGE